MLEAQAEYVVRTPGGPILFNGEQTSHVTAITTMAPLARYPLDETSGTTMVDAIAAYDGTYTNGPTSSITSVLGDGSRLFDGSNDYVTIPYAAAIDAAAWTWYGWFQPLNLAAAGFFNKTMIRDAGASHVHLYIRDEVLYASVTSGGETTLLTGGSIREDVWYQIALACDGKNVYLYRDGELEASATRTLPLLPRTSGAWEIACGATSNNYFNGRIDELAYFDRALTISDITRLHAIVDDPQSAYWYMTESPLRDLNARTRIDSYPLADGGVVGDQYADPAHWTLTGALQGTSDANLQTDAQRFRGRLNSLMRGAGLLMWKPSGFPALQTEIRRGEQPEAGRGGPRLKPLLASLISADPRVYSQDLISTTLTLAISGGFTSPFVGPLLETAAVANASTITNDGDAFTPPIIELVGPFDRAVVTRSYTALGDTTIEAFVIERSIADGDTLVIDTGRGRVYTGSTFSALSNAYDALTSGSVLWHLAPGDNSVTCLMQSTASASSCKVKHRHAWLP